MNKDLSKNVEYQSFLQELKGRIQKAQIRVSFAVNRELVMLYWQIGRDILNRQNKAGWGSQIIDRLASDLRKAFPGTKGFSARNLKYMRKLAKSYPEESFVQQVAAQIPWFHNCVLLDKAKDPKEREWYIQQTIKNGWSRSVLVMQIESGLYHRQGKALSNFKETLQSPQSDLAQQLIKDPYHFDFLTMGPEAKERDLHRGLLEHLRDFLIELGKGFAFVGSEYPLEIAGEEFRLDLLFYHLDLRSYVVIDLKISSFKPEYVGKMNFYLSAVDDILRHGGDQPSIGIILCKDKNKVIVEYTLRDITKPIGVSEFRVKQALPERLRDKLPTIEDIEAEINTALNESSKK